VWRRPFTRVYSRADDRIQPGRVALGDLEAGQSAGFDDEVIHAQLDVLGFHLLQRGGGGGVALVTENNHLITLPFKSLRLLSKEKHWVFPMKMTLINQKYSLYIVNV